MVEVIKTWILARKRQDEHMKIMADHLLRCADIIGDLRRENEALRERGDALAFVFEHNDWSIEMAEQIAMQVASWREMQGVAYE